jgi:hypothetical protein
MMSSCDMVRKVAELAHGEETEIQRKRFAGMQIIPILEGMKKGRQRLISAISQYVKREFLEAKLRPLLRPLTACAVVICYVATKEGGFTFPASAHSPAISRSGAAPLQPSVLGRAPIVRILRDDRVATIEMDYNARNPVCQDWVMSGSPDDDASFLVTWWPQATAQSEIRPMRPSSRARGCA